jgi:hypothetical protein
MSIIEDEAFGITWNIRKTAIDAEKCTLCDTVISFEQFRDDLSINEYLLYGLCQKCQDKSSNNDFHI